MLLFDRCKKNDLHEQSAEKICPKTFMKNKFRNRYVNNLSKLARMTGSGATCFRIYEKYK